LPSRAVPLSLPIVELWMDGPGESPFAERPALFPLSDGEILDAVAFAIACRIDTDRDAHVPDELLPFHESHFYCLSAAGAVFSGSKQCVHELLSCVVNTGLDSKALIISYCFIERILKVIPPEDDYEPVTIPARTAKAIIVATLMLASKYHYDKGVRMRTLRNDLEVCESLGDGLLHLYGRVEEHVLTLLNWALRVGPDEYTGAYARLVQLAAMRSKSRHLAEVARPVHHVSSFPSELAALNTAVVQKRRITPRTSLSRANLPHPDGSRGAPARLQTSFTPEPSPEQSPGPHSPAATSTTTSTNTSELPTPTSSKCNSNTGLHGDDPYRLNASWSPILHSLLDARMTPPDDSAAAAGNGGRSAVAAAHEPAAERRAKGAAAAECVRCTTTGVVVAEGLTVAKMGADAMDCM